MLTCCLSNGNKRFELVLDEYGAKNLVVNSTTLSGLKHKIDCM